MSVLLVHGWSSRAAHMAAFVTPLEEAGLAVVAFDAPAHGRSAGARTDVWEIAETLVRLEKEHGPFEGIITHSMGALACATAMASGALQVRRIVCVAPAMKQTNFVDGFARIVGLPEPVAANLAMRIEAMTGAAFWDRAVIPVPALLIHDSADEFIPMADVEALQEQWPAAHLIPTSGLGHLGILTDLKVVKRAVEFVVGRPDAKQHT